MTLRQRLLVPMSLALWLALAAGTARGADSAPGTDTTAQRTACSALATRSFFDVADAPTAIVSAAVVEATDSLPAYCRVVATVTPQVGVEVGLPLEGWNGKLMMQGCGGTCGVRALSGCEDMLARRYAVVHTDMGHVGRPLLGGSWAHGNLAALIDFGYRGTHVALLAAKAIQTRYYGQPPRYSYFRGCSTGGRQGMVEAQRFPGDFDGIVAIAPPLDETGISALHLAWTARAATARDGRAILDSADVKRVAAAVLAACDGADGVADGVVQNPLACRWAPEQLACKPGSNLAGDGQPCLTTAKVAALRKIYEGARDSAGRRLFQGGMALGSEAGWSEYFTSNDGKPARLLDPTWLLGEFFRYLMFWDTPGSALGIMDFDFDRDPARLGLVEPIYSAGNADLRPFKARSGKLILVGGWADPLIPVPSLIDYYETTTRLMGGAAATRDFFRLFLVPGMLHCVGGAGADAIDYVGALEAWVERGQAPDALLAAHLVKPQSMLRYARHPLADGQADWTRPVYAWPEVAVFSGQGDWHDAGRWAPAPIAAPR